MDRVDQFFKWMEMPDDERYDNLSVLFYIYILIRIKDWSSLFTL